MISYITPTKQYNQSLSIPTAHGSTKTPTQLIPMQNSSMPTTTTKTTTTTILSPAHKLVKSHSEHENQKLFYWIMTMKIPAHQHQHNHKPYLHHPSYPAPR